MRQESGARMTPEQHLVSFDSSSDKPIELLMKELRSWFDSHRICPTLFKHAVAKTGEIDARIAFETSEQADLFEQFLAQSTNQRLFARPR
jgi:hypothetical protein